MEGYRLRSAHGDTVDPRQPLIVDSVEAQGVESVTPTLTYNGKAAAGAITVNSLTYKPIITIAGDQVASYWGEEQNKVYTAYFDTNKKKGSHWLTSFTETATAAAFVVYDAAHNLENMFESVTGTTKRFIVKATDTSGNVLYGWIRGVSISGSNYTFEVFNAKTAETAQSWVGNTTNFAQASVEKIEIYHFNSSLTFNTGTTLTEEVPCPKEYSKNWENPIEYANSLSNGQYFVDYMRARVIGKKADTTASETVTYNIWSTTSVGVAAAASDITKVGGVAVPTAGADAVSNTRSDVPTSARLSGFNGTTWDRLKAGITTVTSTLTGWLNTLPWAVYNSSQATRTNGQGGPLQADSVGNLNTNLYTALFGEDATNNLIGIQNKPVAVSTYAWSVDKSAALEASTISKATAGNIRYFSGRIDSTAPTATYYLLAMNSATLPADGAVTLLTAPTKINHITGTDTPINLDYTMNTVYSSAGIVYCLSSTEFTKTISGAYLSATVLYI